MKINQVAAQLYTLRDHLKTPEDIARSLKKVRAIGYQAVQVSGMGPIGEAELLKILANEGLTCCATHEPGQVILPGSVTAAIPVGPGDIVTATFAGLGSVTARFTAEQAGPGAEGDAEEDR